MNQLRSRALTVLNPEGLELLSSIEHATGRVVGFEANPFPMSASELNPNALELRVEADSAFIFARRLDDLSANGIVHELLHLRRFWIDRVPQLVPADANNLARWEFTGGIENTLEHLVIVPQEAELGVPNQAYWDQQCLAGLAGYPWPDIDIPEARRRSLLLGRLASEFATHPAAKARSTEVLRADPDGQAIENAAQRIIPLVRLQKARAVSAAIRAIGIPRPDVRLRTFDPIRGQMFDVKVPVL